MEDGNAKARAGTMDVEAVVAAMEKTDHVVFTRETVVQLASVFANAAAEKLTGYSFAEMQGRPLAFLHAYSALEARAILKREPDIAVVLLDVVMERPDAFLRHAGVTALVR